MPPFPLLPGQTANPDDYECSYRTNYGNDRGCATYVKCAVYETHRALCPPKPKKAWIRHFYPCKDYYCEQLYDTTTVAPTTSTSSSSSTSSTSTSSSSSFAPDPFSPTTPAPELEASDVIEWWHYFIVFILFLLILGLCFWVHRLLYNNNETYHRRMYKLKGFFRKDRYTLADGGVSY